MDLHLPGFVTIPPGEFWMGRSAAEGHRFADALPYHQVTITGGFAMAITPVTRKQWVSVMGPGSDPLTSPNHPQVTVSWDDAQGFLGVLREMEPDAAYRLPSEAEWEYAARAGTSTRFGFGDSETVLDSYGWYSGNSAGVIHAVGLKKPNRFGLHDMHGNIGEWCQDTWHDSYAGSPADGGAWETAAEDPRRVRRGGSAFVMAAYCGSAARHRHQPDERLRDVGVRLVRHL